MFYDDLPSKSFLNKSPNTWICGDLHLENFGSYKADNRLVYFDITDFDESALAPCLWDVSRLIVSIMIANETLKTDKITAIELSKNFLNGYTNSLKDGYSRLVQEATAKGMVRDFLENLEHRNRKDFINSRTIKTGNKRKLLVDNIHVSNLGKNKKDEIALAISTWAAQQENPAFYKVLDAGYRIAGTGSLGLERYALLVEGKGSPDGNYLLDLKIANPSCLKEHLNIVQPAWKNEAERIINIQKRIQAFPLALLSSIKMNKQWFVLKELQPTQDKIDLRLCKGKPEKLQPVINTMADILAWDQLRSGGRQGSATADELIDFASTSSWKKELIAYCVEYTEKVKSDYQIYSKAYDNNFFGI